MDDFCVRANSSVANERSQQRWELMVRYKVKDCLWFVFSWDFATGSVTYTSAKKRPRKVGA